MTEELELGIDPAAPEDVVGAKRSPTSGKREGGAHDQCRRLNEFSGWSLLIWRQLVPADDAHYAL